MKEARIIKGVVIILLLFTTIIQETSADDPDPYETDVSITSVTVTQEGLQYDYATTEERAPTYHDILVDSENYHVTFCNSVSYDHVTQSQTQFRIKIYLQVWEVIDEVSYEIDEVLTFDSYYYPPFNHSDIDELSFDVDLQGASTTHEYDVLSNYYLYKIQGEAEIQQEHSTLGVNAFVTEI